MCYPIKYLRHFIALTMRSLPLMLTDFSHWSLHLFSILSYSLSSHLKWLNSWPYSLNNGTSTIMAHLTPLAGFLFSRQNPTRVVHPLLPGPASPAFDLHRELLIYTVILSVFPLKDHEDNGFISVSSQSLGLPSLAHWLAFGVTSPPGETPATNLGVSEPVWLTDLLNLQNQPGNMGQGLMSNCDILIRALQAHLARQMHMCWRGGNWG